MNGFCNQMFPVEHNKSTERVVELQRALTENSYKLEEVKKERLRVELEAIHCTREMERIVELMVEKSAVVGFLQQVGRLMQEERQLSDELNGQDRNQRIDLQERSERITNKARSLAAEILEVKQHLAEAKARNIAAQALIREPAGKSKRNQSKPK